MKRVVLTGSESTGKTTLAERLAYHYGVSWVPEFVRDYAVAKGAPLDASDVDAIARGQIAREDEYRSRAARDDERLLIGDTDLLSTAVYAAHYYGRAPDWLVDAAHRRRPNLYLLLDIDLPWIADPQRDRGHLRSEMHTLFHSAVEDSGAPFVLVSGDSAARFDAACAAIDALIRGSGAPGQDLDPDRRTDHE
ncbi:MAG TPA: ATP-binding protein [Gemmatimonadaceae bacterium]|nr:ATP-binding protein [Gemmatimonadaceae bacterium]